MARNEGELQGVRSQLIGLFESDDWRVAESAVRDARQLGFFTQWSVCEFILEKLNSTFPMHCIQLGEPPGSSGTGYVMSNADAVGLYIKLKIEDDEVWVLSFHRSKHSKTS